ncbi:oligopeptide ABC transporter, permease protein [Oceanicola granulosus HTCC2516]|uniref:Oligopeptide ABC transporter, permease protein n=1 Tax=Oceanicola granulosus (strain ATCC BAA-861 / DSM 15982 / KCTC 12143 / HTCC2516) TaxID=314256 RepID=Q2CGU4_OCEGH|nr:ABC transporter permease [Oceanicola granulosus]EAR51841.1 oligopeptide ABC transporter, permease protein [Oceanicola granulosus HTCC2516]
MRALFQDNPFRLYIGLALLLIVSAIGLVLPWFTPVDPLEWYTAPRNQGPSGAHPLGTTSLGQDIFWLLTWAVRNSLILGVSVAFLSTLIGVFLGLTAGYVGGGLDRFLSFLMDALICIPTLPILILLAALFGGQLSLVAAGVALVVFNWPFPGRQVRAVALSMREREFVNVAWFSGERRSRILTRHIFPYIAGWSAANFINTVLVAIATESALAVIGLSSASQATVGTMIYWALKYQALLGERYIWIGAPVVVIVALFIGLFLMSSGLAMRSSERRMSI